MPDTTSSMSGQRVRAAIYLIVFAAAAAGILATAERFTQPRITDNQLAQRMKALQALLPAEPYNNEPHHDFVLVQHPELLGSDEPMPVYRIRMDQEPIAAILTVVAPDGFSDRIRLLVSIHASGKVLGVRAVEHRETPGLGDKIDAQKSSWIDGFAGLDTSSLLENPLADEWTLDNDGGTYDHITGATVTSRAVVNAVRNAVLYFNSRSTELFSAPAQDWNDD